MRQKGYREFEAGLRDTLSSRSTWATVGSSDPKELPKINCFVFICMGVLPFMCNASSSQKRALDHLELEKQVVVSCRVGVGE